MLPWDALGSSSSASHHRVGQRRITAERFSPTDFIKIKTTGRGGRMNFAAKTDPLPIQILPADRLLTAAEFQKLADVPP